MTHVVDVHLAYQPPDSSTFLSEQTSTSHQPPAKRTGYQTNRLAVFFETNKHERLNFENYKNL
jgi:hypothetical protein